jgi:hypothetical protein
MGRLVTATGATVGAAFTIAPLSGVAYVNKPVVAYSHDTADDVFFVMFATDRGKNFDGPPSAWMQRVTFTGTGGALTGSAFLASDGVYELPNDLVYNPFTRQFVAVWERIFSEGADVLVRFFNANGSPATSIVNVTSANWSQGAAKAAVDWQTNRIMITYQGVHPNSPANPEQLGLWAKVVDGANGAVLTGLLTVQNGFTIEPVPVFLPERNGFVVAWTGFNPGRDVFGRFVSTANGSVGSMPQATYGISTSSRQEGAPMGIYDAISRRVVMAVQSSGGCPNDTCPFLDGAILDGLGNPLSSFTGLSTVTPSSNGGTFYPDVAVGEGGQFGFSYTLDYIADYVERVSLPAAGTPGPVFGGGGGTPNSAVLSPTGASFSIVKNGSAISGFTPQSVSVSFATSPVAWTASTSNPWLQVTNGSGSGNGQFTVTVINPSDVIGSQTLLNGSVVLTAPGAPNSPVTLPVTVSVSAPGGGSTVTNQGATAVSSGPLSVIHGLAYAARHDVYLMAYESPNGVQGRFVSANGATVGAAFTIASLAGISYANKPVVAYSNDSDDDVFFVMFGTDRGKAFDGLPSAWIQRVSFTGTGGALVGNAFLASEGVYESPNDLIFNPVTRQFVAVWERFFSEGPDVMVRFFNVNGTPATGVVNVTSANWSQGAAKAAMDWQTNRILIAYQGLHPNSPANPEQLGLWAKIVDGSNGAVLTGLLTVQNGFTIEPVPVFLPERNGFVVAWTGFNPGRDVMGRFVSSANGSVGSIPGSVYGIATSGRQEGAPMGMYDAISRRVLMAVQSSGGCPNDTCPYLDGAVLDAQGAVLTSFTGLSTVAPSSTGGTFYPDVAVGEGGQFGVSYTLNYSADYVERVALAPAGTPGPIFGGGGGPVNTVTVGPTSASFAVTKSGAAISGFSPKAVNVTFAVGPLAWTATTSSPWLQVTGGSGNGNGQFSVTVINPGDVIGSQTLLNGSVVLTAAGAPNSPVTLPVSVSVTLSQASGVNLNGDGNGDVFLYRPSNGQWAQMTTTSDGKFNVAALGSWATGWDVHAAWFNTDALTDFFVFNPNTGVWYKSLNNGSGGFTDQADGQWWPGWHRYIVDLNGDGISDVFLFDPATGAWFKCFSTPAGFTYEEGAWTAGWQLYPANLNGDAYADFFLYSPVTGRWYWVLGKSGSGFTYQLTSTWATGWNIYPGDFNGDTLSDMLLHNPSTGQYYVAMNAVSGFSLTTGVWSLGWTPRVADLNGDGSDDLFLHAPVNGLWMQLISNKVGQFTFAGSQQWATGWDLYPMDLNGDGRTDFLLFNPTSGVWYQARNLVLGTFSYTNGLLAPGLDLTVVVKAPER